MSLRQRDVSASFHVCSLIVGGAGTALFKGSPLHCASTVSRVWLWSILLAPYMFLGQLLQLKCCRHTQTLYSWTPGLFVIYLLPCNHVGV
jgi:hypothetical protein